MLDVTTGRSENELPALGICFEEYAYPHPVRFIPNARRVVIPECGHIPHIEHPAQFLDAFMPFLAS